MKSFVFLILIFNMSCASNKNNNGADDITGSKDEIKDLPIDNKDFKVKKPKTYIKSADYYEKRNGLLESETQFRVIDDNSKKDIITEIVKDCYYGKFEEAFALQKENYQEYLENPGFWNQIGTCHYLQGSYRKALLYYNRSREIDKNYTPAINNMGVLFQAQGKDSKAIEMFKQAIDSSPMSKTPKFNLGSLYLKYGLVDKSEVIINSLLKASPNDIGALNLYAHLQGFKGNWNESLKYFEKLLNQKGVSHHSTISAALVYIKNGKKNKAEDLLQSLDVDSLGEDQNYYNKVSTLVESL
jgi:tetratricopeptide (TPR) repeat protein